MKDVIKPHRYIIDTQKNFEKHPYLLMNANMTHEEYKNDINRIRFNQEHPYDIKEYFQTPIMKLLAATNKTFSLAWLILGAIIFWGLIDNNKCNDGLYNYMYASLIIMIIFTVINLYQIVKETK